MGSREQGFSEKMSFLKMEPRQIPLFENSKRNSVMKQMLAYLNLSPATLCFCPPSNTDDGTFNAKDNS